MRNVILALLISGLLLWGLSETAAQAIFLRLVNSTQQLLYSRDVRLSGLQRVLESDVLDVLPQSRSNIYWKFFSSEIERKLSSNPWIEKAELKNCQPSSFSCFRVELVERIPRFLARIEDRSWLLDSAGHFLSAIDSQSAANLLKGQGAELIEIESLAESQSSPDISRARVLHVSRLLDYLEREVGERVSRVAYLQGGDLIAHFSAANFDAVFSAQTSDDQILHREVDRLKRVLKEFEGKTAALAKVDLAFDRSVVVTTKSSS